MANTININDLLKWGQKSVNIQSTLLGEIRSGALTVTGFTNAPVDKQTAVKKLIGTAFTDKMLSTGRVSGSKYDLTKFGVKQSDIDAYQKIVESINVILAKSDTKEQKIRVHYYNHNDAVK